VGHTTSEPISRGQLQLPCCRVSPELQLAASAARMKVVELLRDEVMGVECAQWSYGG